MANRTTGTDSMKMMLLGGVLITLPATVVLLFFFGRTMMIPAIASLSINLLPFIVAGILLRDKDPEGVAGH
jgi:hypothetical protein